MSYNENIECANKKLNRNAYNALRRSLLYGILDYKSKPLQIKALTFSLFQFSGKTYDR